MHATAITRVVPTALTALRRRLDRWRDARTHPSPIPEPLWAAAIGLAQQYGVRPTAYALRLNPRRLGQRLEQASRAGSASRSPTFVELTPPRAARSAACVIAVTLPGGGTMRVELATVTMADLAALCRSVWSQA